MARELSERTQAVVLVLVLGAAIGGLYGYIQASNTTPLQAASVTGVTLVVEGVNWTIRYGPVTTTNNTAFGILVEASQRLGFRVDAIHYDLPPAEFVTAVNGSVNGQGGLWWQYWVDGVYGNVGADHFALSNGAQVLWRFATNQEAAA